MGTLEDTQIVDQVLNLAYDYDLEGNVTAIDGFEGDEIHAFAYDHRDRLTNWWLDGGLQ
ncbi:MAG: hypothetical protein KDI03_19045 [Anaerolineae bacterium]|nr:hypothetical protein [Anaerolineae bacterium]